MKDSIAKKGRKVRRIKRKRAAAAEMQHSDREKIRKYLAEYRTKNAAGMVACEARSEAKLGHTFPLTRSGNGLHLDKRK